MPIDRISGSWISRRLDLHRLRAHIIRLAALSIVARVADGRCQGSIGIVGVGQVYASGDRITPLGATLSIQHNSGISVTNTCQDNWDPADFTNFKLLSQTLAYTVDLSRVGCACNLAFYLVQEPALDAAGNPSQGTCGYSPYYCDANRVCGQWCPEVDIMEANSHVFQATPHRCDPSSTPQYTNCDRGGIGRNTKDLGPNVYGPGPGFTIDTTTPFEVHTSFYGRNGSNPVFSGMTTVLKQGGNAVELANEAGPTYLTSLAGIMETGMALRITYWGEKSKTMSWLDGDVCSIESCTGGNAGPAEITNIRLFPAGSPGPPPMPLPFGSPSPAPPPPGPTKAAEWRRTLFGMALLMAGAGLLVLSAAAHQSQQTLQEWIAWFLGELDNRGWLNPILNGFEKTQAVLQNHAATANLPKVWQSFRERFDQIIQLGISCATSVFHHTRTGCLWVADVVGELSRQRAWNETAFQAALRKAGDGAGRHTELAQDELHQGDRVTVTGALKLPTGLVGKSLVPLGTRGEVIRTMIDTNGGSAAVVFEGWGKYVLSEEQLLALQVEGAKSAAEKRRRDGIKILVVTVIGLGLAIVVIHGIVAATTSGGGAPPPVAVGKPIPAGGCCSFDGVGCGPPSEFCQDDMSCEESCYGKWMVPV